MLALARQNGNADAKTWLGSLSRRGEANEILTSLGTLYRRGFDIDWEGFNRPSPGRRVSLPTYPFEHRRFWIEADAAPRPLAASSKGLTGVRLRSAMPDAQFENTYSLQRFGYLDDHRIYGMPVLPTTVGLAALRDAAGQYFGSDTVEIANLQYREAMVLPESGERIVQSILTPRGQLDGRVSVRQHVCKWRRRLANPHGRRGAQGEPGAQWSRRSARTRSHQAKMRRVDPGRPLL